jgi:hypothetical protein
MKMKPKIVQGNCGKVSIVTRDGAESVKTNHNLKERNIKCFAWRDDITEGYSDGMERYANAR